MLEYLKKFISYLFSCPSSISVIISLFALLLSSFSYKYNKNRGKVDRAIEMADKYQKLIKEISEIMSILSKHKEVYEISTNKIDEKNLVEFTRDEALDLYTNEQFDMLCKFHFGDGMDVDLLKGHYLANSLASGDSCMGFVLAVDNDTKAFDNVIKQYYRSKINGVLNSLEAFSMAFVQNVADEDVVYQSLHQSYFKIVKLLYFRIAYANNKPTDKYFTNIIELYKIWQNKLSKQQKKIDKDNQRIIQKEEKYNKKSKKMKKKAGSVRPKRKL